MNPTPDSPTTPCLNACVARGDKVSKEYDKVTCSQRSDARQALIKKNRKVAMTNLVLFQNLVFLVVLKLFGPTTAACPLDDKKSLVE